MASYFGNTSKKSWSNFSVVAETLNSVHITLRWPRSQTIWYSNQFFLSYVLKYDRKTFNKYILIKCWLDHFGYFEYFPSSAHSAPQITKVKKCLYLYTFMTADWVSYNVNSGSRLSGWPATVVTSLTYLASADVRDLISSKLIIPLLYNVIWSWVGKCVL